MAPHLAPHPLGSLERRRPCAWHVCRVAVREVRQSTAPAAPATRRITSNGIGLSVYPLSQRSQHQTRSLGRRWDGRTGRPPSSSPRRADRPSGSDGRLAGLHPVAAFLLSADRHLGDRRGVSILSGCSSPRCSFRSTAVQDADEWLPDELAAERTSFLNDVSYVISDGVGWHRPACDPRRPDRVCAWLRHCSSRPLHDLRARARVGDLPRDLHGSCRGSGPTSSGSRASTRDASYPSGHTAASLAVYVGLALLATVLVKNRPRGSRSGSSRS